MPNEADYDTPIMFEQFLDQLTEVARARGKTKILLPGDSGAMSNYRRTINHNSENYINRLGQSEIGKRIELAETFNFNGYDLTNKTYVAREVPISDN